MEPKKSKYDTNPLDPDYVRNTEEVWDGEETGAPTQPVKGATREISSANESARENVYSEAPTRRYDSPSLESPYPSIFVPPPQRPVAPYQPSPAPFRAPDQRPTARSVEGIGLPEKWALVLPYAPFYIGAVVSLIELFLVPHREARVRYHASQALAIHIAILALQTIFGLVETITGSGVGGALFTLAYVIFLIVSMVRVGKGQPHHIAPAAEPADWLNQHIKPRK